MKVKYSGNKLIRRTVLNKKEKLSLDAMSKIAEAKESELQALMKRYNNLVRFLEGDLDSEIESQIELTRSLKLLAARKHTDLAIEILINAMKSEKLSEEIKVHAAEEILNRGWGHSPSILPPPRSDLRLERLPIREQQLFQRLLLKMRVPNRPKTDRGIPGEIHPAK